MPIYPEPVSIWHNGRQALSAYMNGNQVFGGAPPVDTSPEQILSLTSRTLTSTNPVFPITKSSDNRGFVDATGAPFYGVGDTVWHGISRMTKAEWTTYCQTRKSQGYNTIFVSLVEVLNRNYLQEEVQVLPFSTAIGRPNLKLPNDVYFNHAEWCLDYAASLGLLCVVVPAWYGGWGDRWRAYIADSDTDTTIATAYGLYLAARFGGKTNIWWMHGGDNGPDLAGNNTTGTPAGRKFNVIPATNALANTLKANATVPQLATYHTYRYDTAFKYFANEPWYDLHAAYGGTDTGLVSLTEYQRTNVKPVVMVEAYYDATSIAEATPQLSRERLRALAYQAMLSGAFVSANGNELVWHVRGKYPNFIWNTPGHGINGASALDLKIVSRVFEMFPEARWVPDAASPLVTVNRGSGESIATGALSKDGKYALIYVPTARTITVNTTKLLGSPLFMWVNPGTGATVPVSSRPIPSTFTTPTGWTDAVLVVGQAQTQ